MESSNTSISENMIVDDESDFSENNEDMKNNDTDFSSINEKTKHLDEQLKNLVPSVAEGPKDGLKMVVDAIRKLMQPMGSTAETIYRRICADNMDVSSSYINVLVKDGINRGLKQNVLLAVTANCFALNGTGNSEKPKTNIPKTSSKSYRQKKKYKSVSEDEDIYPKACNDLPATSASSSTTIYGSQTGFPDEHKKKVFEASCKRMSDEDCQTVQCAMKRGRQKCRKKSKRKKQRERRCQQYEMSDSDDNEINMCGKAARCATRAFRRMGPVNTRAGTTCSSEISELNQAKQCGKCSSLPSDDRKIVKNLRKNARRAMEKRRAQRIGCKPSKPERYDDTTTENMMSNICKRKAECRRAMKAASAATNRYKKRIDDSSSSGEENIDLTSDGEAQAGKLKHCLQKIRKKRRVKLKEPCSILSSSDECLRMRRRKRRPKECQLGCKNQYRDKPRNIARRMAKKLRRYNKSFYNLW